MALMNAIVAAPLKNTGFIAHSNEWVRALPKFPEPSEDDL
jgi:hypothetical protein